MNTNISQKEIGQRITTLRKMKGLSQEEMSKSIGMSRPSFAQLELGKRNMDVLEFHRLSLVLGFSLDEFMSENFMEKLSNSKLEEREDTIPEENIRISVPELQIDKFRNVLLYILEHCAGKPNFGETVLNKLLYFCDFNYYELYEEHLTGALYRKLPYGPVPQNIDQVIHQMTGNGQLKRVKTEYHGFNQTRYLPLEKADLTGLSAAEKTVIDDVVRQMGDWNANKISEYSHKDIPWMATKEGAYIGYNLAFYREAPYTVRVYEEDENGRL